MTAIKCMLCCTMAEPSLYKNPSWQLGEWYKRHDPEFLTGDKKNLRNIKILNGTVCFECEIVEAEKIENTLLHMAPTFMHETKTLCDSELLRRACLTPEEADEYMPKHALYLENVKEIEPFPITALARRDPTGLNIAEGLASGMLRAPQNMCWAWRWNEEERKWERVLVLSLRPRHLCNIANGLKDIETRRQVVYEIKEMEK